MHKKKFSSEDYPVAVTSNTVGKCKKLATKDQSSNLKFLPGSEGVLVGPESMHHHTPLEMAEPSK